MNDVREDVADYDEFDALQGYAEWSGVPWTGPPVVGRRSVEVDGRRVSMLAWGEGTPRLAFLHGGMQNAHTWDTVAMAVAGPSVAFDLPGHGHSDWREDGDYWPGTSAATLASALERVAPDADALIGMSMGGLTSIRLAASRPDLVRRLVVVDVTPGVSERVVGLTREEQGAVATAAGPSEFDSFEDMLATLAATMPHRPVDSLRPGLRHNAMRRDDGKWIWRYDRIRRRDADENDAGAGQAPAQESIRPLSLDSLWVDVGTLQIPVMLVRGGNSKFVHDDDVERLRREVPGARVEVVEGAGHSVQSDRPVELARLIEDFVWRT
jgi:pimeloyl-ACP methyl ester carboxylesterase